MSASLLHGTQLKVDYTPGSAVTAGTVIDGGLGTALIASVNLEASRVGSLAYPNGCAVYRVTKESGGGVVFLKDQDVYYDTSNATAVEAAGANIVYLGKATAAAADGDSRVDVCHMPAGGFIIPDAAPQAISDAGAASLLTFSTRWTTTGAAAGTLADGLYLGQQKKIQLIVDGGDLTLTPASFEDGTTIIFADAGDWALFVWNGANWRAVDYGNDADGATGPVIA